MADLVCVVYPTIMDGRVVRWFSAADIDSRRELISASRNRISIHVPPDEIPDDVMALANRAVQILAAGGPEDEVYAMATHRPRKFMSAELEPIGGGDG